MFLGGGGMKIPIPPIASGPWHHVASDGQCSLLSYTSPPPLAICSQHVSPSVTSLHSPPSPFPGVDSSSSCSSTVRLPGKPFWLFSKHKWKSLWCAFLGRHHFSAPLFSITFPMCVCNLEIQVTFRYLAQEVVTRVVFDIFPRYFSEKHKGCWWQRICGNDHC